MKDSADKDIPKIFHLIWIGGKIPLDYVKAIEKLAAAAERDGFSVNIWTDRSSQAANAESFARIPNLTVQSTEDLLIAMANDPDSPFTEDEKANLIKIILFECLPPANYAAASDFFRLLFPGGVYLDTDIRLLAGWDGNLPLHEALLLDEIAKDGGVFHMPDNNDFIIYTKGNEKIIDCMHEMIRKASEGHSMPEGEYEKLVDKSRLAGEAEQKAMDELIRERFFTSEEAFFIAKKSPIFLEHSEAGIVNNDEAKGVYTMLTKPYNGSFFSNDCCAPYGVIYTVEIGPGCLNKHVPCESYNPHEAFSLFGKFVEAVCNVFRMSNDHTWIDKAEKSPEKREEIINETKKSVRFFFERIKPLSLGDLLKVLAHKGDLYEALSLVESGANYDEVCSVVPGGFAQRVLAENLGAAARGM